MIKISVQPTWCIDLPIQQQSVLFLAGRGPDGIAKAHPCKRVQKAYRASVFVAARYGRCLEWGEGADTFMGLEEFADDALWAAIVKDFFNHIDDLPHHYIMHLMHGVEILGYKHPDIRFQTRWRSFYIKMVEDCHLNPESAFQMNQRLSDGNRKHWGN